MIEHPAWTTTAKIISKEKPYETTRDVHRFEIKVAAGKTAVLEWHWNNESPENETCQNGLLTVYNEERDVPTLFGGTTNTKSQGSSFGCQGCRN